MYAEVVSDVGLVRKNNEDSLWCDLEQQLFAVADGMGGSLAGEVASKMAIETVAQMVALPSNDPPGEILRHSFYQANNSIFQQSREHKEYSGMGTTMSALWIVDGKAYFCHVGDSRIYLIREGKIRLLTQDHSLVGELMRGGGLTEVEAMTHPQKNVLTRALGVNAHVEVDTMELDTYGGDYFILCTDGLSNLIRSEEMIALLTPGKRLRAAADELLKLALARGGSDNITAILIYRVSVS
ncbi:Stp1/IreP family PP2C-type Ser/Thr phosphatase [Dehalobacterium formicoaceticum]|uniref:Stp1/IreP family PP2C-type Ser/Thr phosphatase n=1 Tax=Dehalobacterium formicoaceticum TaxID=51515 RepID=A0ABT1Y259_9FIRM|nr:Stp1/IreP family PP2C-type Ser/Thr phosphatase [Dehalobacterium formicoaceticum]MCR6544643.1 Stp1/IreP family PP2C-type Ser/Thr phosphatase [Dehalobacterium formicoaceticum]